MELLIFTLTAVSAFAAPGNQFIHSPNTVIQGERVQAEEPIAGNVLKIRMQGGSCTGTALSSTVVMTAAHCPDMGGTVLAVAHLAGEQIGCGIAEVEEVAYVPGATLNEKKSHVPDIALLKLKTPLCGITPAVVRGGPTKRGDIVSAAGYGRGTSTLDRPDRLALKTIDANDLKIAYADAIAADPSLKDALDYIINEVYSFYTLALPVVPQTSLCNGDSGGPVYLDINGQTQLIGVNGAIAGHALKGTDKCKFGYLQMFTPLAPYKAWIDSKLQEWR